MDTLVKSLATQTMTAAAAAVVVAGRIVMLWLIRVIVVYV
jgi:hypothetical protein